jgi:hypothetical protein
MHHDVVAFRPTASAPRSLVRSVGNGNIHDADPAD